MAKIGDSQHLEIYKSSNKLYEETNDEIQYQLNNNPNFQFYDDLGTNSGGFNPKKNSKNERMNKEGLVSPSQEFEFGRKEEKDFEYNPADCGKIGNLLEDCIPDNYKTPTPH